MVVTVTDSLCPSHSIASKISKFNSGFAMACDCDLLKKNESIEYRHRPGLCHAFSSLYARLELSGNATMMFPRIEHGKGTKRAALLYSARRRRGGKERYDYGHGFGAG